MSFESQRLFARARQARRIAGRVASESDAQLLADYADECDSDAEILAGYADEPATKALLSSGAPATLPNRNE